MNKEELEKVLKEMESTISYNDLDTYDVSDSSRDVYDTDGVVRVLLLARDTIKKLLNDYDKTVSTTKMENNIYMFGGCCTQITSNDKISFNKTCKILGVKL